MKYATETDREFVASVRDARADLMTTPVLPVKVATRVTARQRDDALCIGCQEPPEGTLWQDGDGWWWCERCITSDTIGAAFTYDEALELAAALSTGARLTEMALHGYPQYELPRVPEADRPATEAMLAELKAQERAMQALTRLGRAPVPNTFGCAWQ